MRGRVLRALMSGLVGGAMVVAWSVGSAGIASADDNQYTVTNLVADQSGVAATQDPNLVNAWGLVSGPQTPWWVANNHSNTSTLYDGDGHPFSLVVKVAGGPTGAVFNGGSGFVVSHNGESGPSVFMFATESGTIRGWDPAVPSPVPSTKSFIVVNRSHQGAIFKGLAIANTAAGGRIYATDFHNGKVDVFDSSFQRVHDPEAFVDPDIPAGFAPFGIQTIGDRIYVTYAKQDAAAVDDQHGRGLGYIDSYDLNGEFEGRVASRGHLNAPWGLALAPSDFGAFSGKLLVGNFGNGQINAFDLKDSGPAEYEGKLDSNGSPITIDGLWALQFGNGGVAGPTTSLFFTAGPDDENHGLFGKIEAA